ncbi:MAG TPA: signal peptidase I [Candidatus Saccharimonadales bacterium]|nr:signal peptidase I [Candidatus Saccharimonadales bacterium]
MSGGKFFSTVFNSFILVRWIIVAMVVIVLAVVFLGVPLAVSGQSMEPNFQSGEVVLVQRLSYTNNKPIERGDVVAAKFPADPKHTKLIKRVIGLPGETVTISTDGVIYINGVALNEPYEINHGTPPYDVIGTTKLGEDQYFLMGDNRPGSSDSRLWGPVNKSDIEGQISFVLWPIAKIRYVLRINY